MAEQETTQEVQAQEVTQEIVKDEAKYTNKQLNDLIAKNSAKAAEKAQREFMEKIGVKDLSEIEALKTAREAQMSETEKAIAREKEKDAKIEALQKDSDAKDAVNQALMKGVPADKVERVKKLVMSGVYEGETIADKLDAVLAEFPDYIKASSVTIGTKTQNQTLDANADTLAKARKMAGLT
jgi:uncharacterized protein YgbK (DUF1537 family)